MDLSPAANSNGEEGGLVTFKVGSSKPLHRFVMREPKIVGVVMLFLGSAQMLVGISMKMDISDNSAHTYTVYWLGSLFITCGILYILTKKSPSKKLVTTSLALSIISTIGALLAFIVHLVTFFSFHYINYNVGYEEHLSFELNWIQIHKDMVWSMELIWIIHSLVGAVILIVMTAFARAALRSMRTQATVIMLNQQS